MLILTAANFLLDANAVLGAVGFFRLQFPAQKPFVSSPEHYMVTVSYCDRSMSIILRASSVLRRQQFVLNDIFTYTSGPID